MPGTDVQLIGAGLNSAAFVVMIAAMSVDNDLRDATAALKTAREKLETAGQEAEKGSSGQKENAYELALMSEEALDINVRLLAIMHELNVSHT